MKNHCAAIGYPIGVNKLKDGSIVFCIELQNRIAYVTLDELSGWARISRHDIDDSISTELIASLKKKGVVVWCNNQGTFEQRLQGYTPIRQGYSVIDDKGNLVVYLGNAKHLLTPLQFQLWICADGNVTLSTCLSGLNYCGTESWTDAICVLIRKELIYLR